MSEIRDIINEKNVIIASAQVKTLVSRYELCEEHAFPHLLHKVNLDLMLLEIFQ